MIRATTKPNTAGELPESSEKATLTPFPVSDHQGGHRNKQATHGTPPRQKRITSIDGTQKTGDKPRLTQEKASPSYASRPPTTVPTHTKGQRVPAREAPSSRRERQHDRNSRGQPARTTVTQRRPTRPHLPAQAIISRLPQSQPTPSTSQA